MRGLTAAVLLVLLVLVAVMSPGSVAAEPLPRPSLPADKDVDYQLGGAAPVPAHVGIVVRDRTAPPAAGAVNVCYVNGFQTQPHEKRFWRRHWALVLKRDGRPVVDEAWGEWLLDLRTDRKRRAIARIVGRWTAGCARAGYDAVEFDNLDSFTRSHGLLRRRHAVALARRLVRSAHAAGLLAGQKNLAGFDGTRVGYDFAVAEECGRWRECRRYARWYGDQVLAVEYRRRDFDRTCRAYGARWPVVLRDLDLTPGGVHRYC